MKKLLEVIGVFVVGAISATLMALCGNDTPPAIPLAGPTQAAANAEAAAPASPKPADPLARTVTCPVCGKTVRVSGKEPHGEIACGCGAKLNVAEGEGHSLQADAVEPGVHAVVKIVSDVPPDAEGRVTPELAAPAKEINWRTDSEAAKAEAIRTGKPLLVVQTKTVGCAPCEELKRHVFTDPRVVEYVNARCVPCLVVDRQIFAGESFPFPAMWLRTPAGGGVLWRGPRFQGERAYPIPKEPLPFIAAIKKALGE